MEVPILSLLRGPFDVPLIVTETSTGTSERVSVRAVPRAAGVWATSTGPNAINVSGAGSVIQGLIHSDGAVAVRAAGVTGDAVEFATTLTLNPQSSLGTQTKIAGGGIPTAVTIDDYRPGRSIARSNPTAYHVIPSSACVNGAWSVDPSQVPSGIVYVPCAMIITGSGKVSATLAAEGAITVKASRVTVQPARANAPGLVSGSGAALIGSDATVTGAVIAPSGDVALTGARAAVRCGILAGTVAIGGSSSKITVDAQCVTG